jgi:drug/metabolite transporter (DMT)-like permease
MAPGLDTTTHVIAGMALGFGASVSWALANVAVQRAGRAVGSVRALLWAQVAGAVMVAVAAPLFDGPIGHMAAADWGWLAFAGVGALAAYLCMFYAFQHGRLTVAVPIMSSWSVLSAALSVLLFGERLGARQLAGAATVIAGAIVVSRHAQSDAGPDAKGGTPAGAPRWLLAAAGAAAGFGVLVPVMGRLVPVLGSVRVVGAVYLVDLALGLPIALAYRVPLGPPAGAAWLPVILAGLFETAGFAFITIAARFAPLAIVSPFASLAAALTVGFAWVFLGERPGRGILVGAGLVCAGVVVLAL